MKIAHITIHNFRCFEHAEFSARDYWLLVGANNAGKSNCIDAVRIFYEKDLKYDDERDFPRFATSDKESWIDIVYCLTDDEYANLKVEYRQPDQGVKVRKYLKTTEKDAEGKARSGIYAYVGATVSGEHFYGAKNVQQGKLGDIIYIPDVSVLSDHTKMSGPSALRDLVTDILKKLVKNSPSFQSLTEQFGAFSQTLRAEQTEDKRSLGGLEADINDSIRDWGTSFELQINPINEGDLVKNLVSFKIMDEALQERFEAGQFGQGFQRHLVYTFIRLAAQYQTPGAKPKKKEFAPSMTLILFEEPEAFLHPHQVGVLSADLLTLARQEDHQVIVSTHAPAFVSPNTDDISSIARLERVGGRTEIGQVPQRDLPALFQDNQRLNELLAQAGHPVLPDDLTEDMEAVKYFLWLSSERCPAFFARHVLLVEGPSERVVINHLLRTKRLPGPDGGVFVLDCLGKYNIHRFMNLLSRLRIRHSVLYDADGGSAIDAAVKTAIDESKNAFTHKVEELAGTLESTLGVAPAGRPDRKPQHIMLAYLQGRIQADRLEAFIAILQTLMPDVSKDQANP